MNVRLTYNSTVQAGVWYNSALQMNLYTVSLSMLTHSHNGTDHVICLERIKYFLETELYSTVFIHQDNQSQIQLLNAAGINVTTTPLDPIDQVIGMLLFAKLNSIMENKISVMDLDIVSDLGAQVHFHHSALESTDNIPESGWWYDASPRHNDIVLSTGRKNVLKMNKPISWKMLELDWEDTDHAQFESAAETLMFPSRDDK